MKNTNQTIILPVAYFAPISYYALRKQYNCILQMHENYQKRTIRNRTSISSANGPVTLSVPLQKGKTKLPISEVQISYEEDWHNNHLKTIRSAYGTSPYFDFYYHKIEDVLIKRNEYQLIELYKEIDLLCCKILGLEKINYTESYTQSEDTHINFAQNNDSISMESVSYEQVFSSKFPFQHDLSIMDLFFNLGPESITYLKNVKLTFL